MTEQIYDFTCADEPISRVDMDDMFIEFKCKDEELKGNCRKGQPEEQPCVYVNHKGKFMYCPNLVLLIFKGK